MIQFGYIKRHYSGKKGQQKVRINSKPFHYISSDGFHMYVGKNNFQNEELTFKFATGNDWWFHAKQAPGSHVIVQKHIGDELPDRHSKKQPDLQLIIPACVVPIKLRLTTWSKKTGRKNQMVGNLDLSSIIQITPW